MYFPYLYSRQAELNAVSDVSSNFGSPQRIFPLIEPVEPAAKLISTLTDLKSKAKAAYVIVNPHQGKLSKSAVATAWQSDFAAMLADSAVVYPTFKETAATTLKDIASFVAAYPGRKIGIVLATSKLAPGDLAKALSGSDYTVFFLATASSANYLAALGPARTVDVSDNFRSEARNKDYSGEEWLGNNHTSWSAAGRRGFSDFTMLPGTYKDGGGPVGAIAIHLTYALGSDLWIQHFISTTDEQTDPQATKFKEVLGDIQRQRAVTPSRFELSPGLSSYETQRASGNYTNLSGNKRQQVSHHIHTVAKHLGL
ncbi:sce7725 family protein [Microbacterium oxydans]|uniref:Sce7725 family protein n=1 Tax=Microbacterium oxydans TaxID=82380 RepID=A0A0F0LB65_9MICO|nr:sce7725 family protein [Microbacterium oxydans]KJL29550.1 hypothetical protein RS83_01567 [Microbacterium oxydans]